MDNPNIHHDCVTPASPHSEIDYSPKNYTSTESILIILKYFSIAGIIFLLFWIFESYQFSSSNTLSNFDNFTCGRRTLPQVHRIFRFTRGEPCSFKYNMLFTGIPFLHLKITFHYCPVLKIWHPIFKLLDHAWQHSFYCRFRN